MFKFLFGEKIKAAITPETKRQKLERALAEVNEVLAALDPKPKISIDIEAGRVDVAMPEHFPDETRALPAPDRASAPAAAPDATSDAGAPTAPKPAALNGGTPPQPAAPKGTIAQPTPLQPRVPKPRVPTPNPPKPKTSAAKPTAKAES